MLDFRDSTRQQVAIEASCRIGGRRFTALIRDLSGVGCFLSTEERARLGVAIHLVFAPPGLDHQVAVTGEIARVSGPRDDHVGLGVEFVGTLADAAPASDEDVERVAARS